MEIIGYPNYTITNDGVVTSKRGVKQPFLRLGYYRIQLLKDGIPKIFTVHRLVYQHYGIDWDETLTVDHIDMNRTNNHISNLRMATRQQQVYNRPYKVNELGRGVCKRGNKYATYMNINKKKTYLGLFDTPEEANQAYQTKAIELQGEFYRQ
jgi:hypothetical protein